MERDSEGEYGPKNEMLEGRDSGNSTFQSKDKGSTQVSQQLLKPESRPISRSQTVSTPLEVVIDSKDTNKLGDGTGANIEP